MDERFDFVVIGSGAGSFAAALVMRAHGKSVVVLEKTDLAGGTTATSGGVLWIPNNRFMEEAGVKDSVDDAETYIAAVMTQHGDDPAPGKARRRAFFDQAPKAIEFLLQRGLKFRRCPHWPDFYDVPGASEPGRAMTAEVFDMNELGDQWKAKVRRGFLPLPGHVDELMLLPWMAKSWKSKGALATIMSRLMLGKLTGKDMVSGGVALQGRMLQAALGAGADVRLNSPVKEILIENGRAVGVVVEQDGKPRRIGATLGLLINAGGFARNQGMRDRYLPGTSAEWTLANPGDTGEMIEEALRHGGVVANKSARVDAAVTIQPGPRPVFLPMVGAEMGLPHAIVVDQTGVRYMSESGSHVEIGERMMERAKTAPTAPSWIIMDGQFLAKYMLLGTMAGSKKPDEWFTSGFMKRADTIEGLAKAINVEPAKLRATVDRFNGFARKGVDEDFHRGEDRLETHLGDAWHKPSPCLGAIEQAPFIAMQCYPGDVSTYSGVETDENARVVKADGTPIQGLYACGVSSTPSLGRHEVGAGASVGPSLVWGYVAARHAVGANA